MFWTYKKINGVQITKKNTVRDVLHSIYFPQDKDMNDTERHQSGLYNRYVDRSPYSVTYWEKETDKKHDELQREVMIQNQIKRYDKGLGRGKFTFGFDGYEVTVVTS